MMMVSAVSDWLNFLLLLGAAGCIAFGHSSSGHEKRTLWNWAGLGNVNGLNPISHPGPPLPISLPFLPNFRHTVISDCPTGDGNRTGICVSSMIECRRRGGRVFGNCYSGAQNNAYGSMGTNTGSSSFAGNYGGRIVGVCCSYQVTCGGTVLNNGTYFRNPNAPAPYTDSRACSVQIPRTRLDICQIRLDFLIFSLNQPTNGECDKDRFVINGQVQNNVLPPLCGINSGQHMYIDVTGSQGPISLNVITMGHRSRQFDIRITQIPCYSPYRAPSNCLQYYYDLVGRITSFNFDTYNDASTYFNNLDYTICFRKEPGFCTMSYSVPNERDIALGQDNSQINRPQNQLVYFDIQTETKVSDAPGAGILKCPYDFLLLGSVRYCGSRLNRNVYSANPSGNTEVTDNSTGPIFARFVSDGKEAKRGFSLDFRMNPCFIGG